MDNGKQLGKNVSAGAQVRVSHPLTGRVIRGKVAETRRNGQTIIWTHSDDHGQTISR